MCAIFATLTVFLILIIAGLLVKIKKHQKGIPLAFFMSVFSFQHGGNMVPFSERLEQLDLLLLKQAVNKKYAKKITL